MSGSQPGDTIVERSSRPWTLWLLLNANRWLVAGALMAFVFLALVVLGTYSPTSLREYMAEEPVVGTLFQALTTALITGVTLVVTINQLVLSQELGAVADQRERFSGAMEFRRDAEELIDAPVGPPEPASFLQSIVAATDDRATDFQRAVDDSHDEEFRARVADFVDAVTGHAETIRDDLADAEFGTYDVLGPALDYNYSWKIFRLRRLEAAHADAFTDETRAAYEDLLESLELFGLAREHFKTLYFQWELITLSRAMIYAAVPALAVTASMIVFFDVDAATGTLAGIDVLVWTVALATTIAVAPFLVLIAFVLRIATVAKRTLAIGPFILRESTRGEEPDRE